MISSKRINYNNCMQEGCKRIFMTYHARCDWYPLDQILQRYKNKKYFSSEEKWHKQIFCSKTVAKRPNYLRSSFVFLPKNQHKAVEVVHFYTHLSFAHSKWYHEWLKLVYFVPIKTMTLLSSIFEMLYFSLKIIFMRKYYSCLIQYFVHSYIIIF